MKQIIAAQTLLRLGDEMDTKGDHWNADFLTHLAERVASSKGDSISKAAFHALYEEVADHYVRLAQEGGAREIPVMDRLDRSSMEDRQWYDETMRKDPSWKSHPAYRPDASGGRWRPGLHLRSRRPEGKDYFYPEVGIHSRMQAPGENFEEHEPFEVKMPDLGAQQPQPHQDRQSRDF